MWTYLSGEAVSKLRLSEAAWFVIYEELCPRVLHNLVTFLNEQDCSMRNVQEFPPFSEEWLKFCHRVSLYLASLNFCFLVVVFGTDARLPCRFGWSRILVLCSQKVLEFCALTSSNSAAWYLGIVHTRRVRVSWNSATRESWDPVTLELWTPDLRIWESGETTPGSHDRISASSGRHSDWISTSRGKRGGWILTVPPGGTVGILPPRFALPRIPGLLFPVTAFPSTGWNSVTVFPGTGWNSVMAAWDPVTGFSDSRARRAEFQVGQPAVACIISTLPPGGRVEIMHAGAGCLASSSGSRPADPACRIPSRGARPAAQLGILHAGPDNLRIRWQDPGQPWQNSSR